MARDFTFSTGDHVDTGNSPISAYPFTMAGRFKVDNFDGGQNYGLTLYFGATGNIDYGIGPHYGNWSIYGRNTSYIFKASSENTAGVWGQVVGVFASATDRRLYLDGIQIASDTISVPFSTSVDQFSLGAKTDNGPNDSFDGQGAEVCLWDVELTTEEITALAGGTNPRFIQPPGLKVYWKIGSESPVADLSGNGNNGTVVGTTVVDHAPVGPYIVSSTPTNWIAAGGAEATGSAAGSATISGVGVARIAAVGSSAGVTTASGVGEATFLAVGASAGVATVSGTGFSKFQATGSSSGTSTVTATGQGKFEGVAASAGSATVSGVAASDQSIAAATGTSTVSGVGAGIFSGVGSSSGGATVSGSGIAKITGVGSSVGVSSEFWVGLAKHLSTFTIPGVSNVTGIGASVYAGLGSTAGSATVSGVGSSVIGQGVGSSSGVASEFWVGLAKHLATFTISGGSTVSGISPIPPDTTGSGSGRKGAGSAIVNGGTGNFTSRVGGGSVGSESGRGSI